MIRAAWMVIGLSVLIACAPSKPGPESGQDVPISVPIPEPQPVEPKNPDSGKPAPDTRQVPVSDPKFLITIDGRDLKKIKVSGVGLSLQKGAGKSWGSAQQAAFEKLYKDTKEVKGHAVQWAIMDLDTGKVIDQSLESNRRMFGASVAKVYVGAALGEKQVGTITNAQLQTMSEMLVVSSNEAWVSLQKQIGDGDSNRGRKYIHEFTQRMGYEKTKGFQGSWGSLHGNELVASELVELLHDLYWDRIVGGSFEWKLMHTCRTGVSRGRKYLPVSLVVGGKTGTYDGPTELDGKAVRVRVRNHILVLSHKGKQYGMAILADTGSDESSALMAGGLFRKHIDR